MIPINLVFQMSDFRYEIKIELKLRYLLSDLKILTLKIRVRSYATNTQLILVPVLRERQYRLIWLKSKFRVLRRLDFSSTFVSRLLAFSVRFSARSIDRDSLVYIEYRIEPRISTCLLNMNLNKGRD
jgi:hypothetical protein